MTPIPIYDPEKSFFAQIFQKEYQLAPLEPDYRTLRYPGDSITRIYAVKRDSFLLMYSSIRFSEDSYPARLLLNIKRVERQGILKIVEAHYYLVIERSNALSFHLIFSFAAKVSEEATASLAEANECFGEIIRNSLPFLQYISSPESS